MAINTQKLLPQSQGISSALANFSKVSSGLSIQKKTADVNKITQLSAKYNEQNVDIVRRSLIDVDTLLKSVLTEDKNTTESKRRRKEREEFEERESRLEVPKEQRKFRLPQVSLPGMSFLDKVKRFLLFTGIGWLFTNFQDQLPKLVGIVKIITPLYGVVENVFKFILSSVVNFIERGYETYDKIRALVKSVGGEGAQQSFDALSSKLNEYINYILIGGMALTGAISAFATNVSKFKPQAPKPAPAATGRRPRVTTGAGGTSIRSGAARVTTSGGKLVERNIAKNIFRRTVKPVLSKLPIVGALVEFGLSWALGDPVGKAAFRGIGSLLVGAVGTAIGGPIGAAIGGIVGGEVGGRLYDTFFGGKKPAAYRNGGRVIRTYAKGGGVLGDYGLGRTLEVERSRKPAPPPQSTQPGRDVGGKNEIKRLFPNPNENKLTYGKPNPYYALENTASDFKSAPYGLGSLMGGAIDVALGQKLSNNAILNASVGLENMFYDNYDKDKNFIDVRSIIFGVIKSAADSALNNIRNELSKEKRKKEEEKEKPTDQTKSARRDAQISGASQTGVDVGGAVVGYVGSTGRSTGPHIHIETGNGYGGKGGNIPKSVLDNIFVNGKPLSSYPMGDGLGAGRGHDGFDYPMNGNEPIVLKGGLKFVEYDEGWNGAYGNSLVLSDSSGAKYLIAHLSAGPSDPKKIKELQERQKTEQQVALDQTKNARRSPTDSTGIISAGSGTGSYGTKEQRALLKAISFAEGTTGGYGIIYGGANVPELASGKLTVKQVYDMMMSGTLNGKGVGYKSGSRATGKYQFMPDTLSDIVRSGAISWDEKFTPEAQDRAILSRISSFRGVTPELLAKEGLSAKVSNMLAPEFASFPTYSGKSYHKQPVKSLKSIQQVYGAKDGGVIPSGNNYLPKQPSKYNTKSIETYPDYVDGGPGTRIAIQRIIIQKTVPVPMGGKSRTDFMIAGGGGVNNNMSSHRG
jgi:muramidase (phage lysozyme)